MKKHLKLTVRGKVQGVGFRFSCMEAAYKYKVTGFVKNERDGSVYVEAEGPEENLDQFVLWCKRGPVWARINDVIIDEGSLKDYKSFEIKR